MLSRALATALTLLLSLAATIAPAHAQTDKICDGRFERLLRGYTPVKGEFLPFIEDDNAVVACRRQLDRADLDHALIEAFLLWHAPRRDVAAARAILDAACATGRKLACAYAIAIALETEAPRPTAAELARRYEALLDADLPMVATLIGVLSAAQALDSPSELATIKRLLQRASDQGDFVATNELAALAMMDIVRGRAAADPNALRRKAADQGNILIMLSLAEAELGDPERPGTGNPQAAFAWYQRAADSDPRWFQLAIAEASYELAKMLRTGTGTAIDGKEADRYLRRAAELGHEPAKKELQKK